MTIASSSLAAFSLGADEDEGLFRVNANALYLNVMPRLTRQTMTGTVAVNESRAITGTPVTSEVEGGASPTRITGA